MRTPLAILLSLVGIGALLVPRAGIAAPVAVPPATCPPPFRGAPDYPRNALRAGVGGVVYVIIETDACGRVLDATLESSSLRPDLDAEALAATRRWVMPDAAKQPPTGKGTYLARVPVQFQLSDSPRTSEYVTDDACREIRVSGRIATPVDAAGAVLDRLTVDDPCPLGRRNVTDALRYARDSAYFTASRPGPPLLEEYMTIDGDGHSDWLFLRGAQGDYPAVLRMRTVNDGQYVYAALSTLCEAGEAECKRLFERLTRILSEYPRKPLVTPTAQ